MSDPQVRYLNLPQIPEYLLGDIDSLSAKHHASDRVFLTYRWTDAHNTELVKWCNDNISSGLKWGLQVIEGDLSLHIDTPTKTKISYIFDTGGDNVITEFYQDYSSNIMIDSIKILPNRWHILNVSKPHLVTGIEPGRVRISLTGRIF